MGILRLGAVVAVGVALLPAERDKQDHLYERAAAAAKWTVTYCDRNAATCTQAASAWAQFVAKAEFGAKLAYDVMRDDETATAGSSGDVAPVSFERSGTLTQRDMRPAWRGKSANKNGI